MQSELNMVVRKQGVSTLECDFCGKKPKFRCASCKRAMYCGRAHQIRDWVNHRVSCRLYQTAKEIKKVKPHRIDSIIDSKRSLLHRKAHQIAHIGKERVGSFISHNKLNSPNILDLCEKITRDLAGLGFSVIDMFVDDHLTEAILNQVRDLYRIQQTFLPGTLAKEKGNVPNCERQRHQNSIRGDMVTWLDVFAKTTHSAIRIAERNMSAIVSILNKSKLMHGCTIRSRSRVMAACYPGNGARYKRHVDNPMGDGRKLTFILYLNKNYDRTRDGGVLRMYPRNSHFCFDIEPISGRLVIFWSDPRNPHEVLPSFRERFAISVWYFDIVERAKAFVNCELISSLS